MTMEYFCKYCLNIHRNRRIYYACRRVYLRNQKQNNEATQPTTSNDGEKVNGHDGKEVNIYTNKMIKGLQYRLRDNSIRACLTSLHFFTNMPLQRQNFYQNIYQSIQQLRNVQYTCKDLQKIEQMVEKYIILKKNDQTNNLQGFVRFQLKTFKFVINIIQNHLSKQSNSITNINNSIWRLIQLLLGTINSVCEKYDQNMSSNIRSQFSSFLQFDQLQILSQQKVTQNMLLKLCSSVNLNAILIKNLSGLSCETVKSLLLMTENPLCKVECQEIIKNNLNLVIDIIYQNVMSMSEHICNKRKRQSTMHQSSKINLQLLSQYINSYSFIDLLVRQQIHGQNSNPYIEGKLPGICKLQLLNKLLYSSNVNKMIIGKRQMLKHINIQLKSKNKTENLTLDPIVITSVIQERLKALCQMLLQSLKSSSMSTLQLQADLIVNIQVFLGKTIEVKTYIHVYQKYCSWFFNSYVTEIQIFRRSNKSVLSAQIVTKYLFLNRCLNIATILVTKLQGHLLLMSKIQMFYENKIASMVENKEYNSIQQFDGKNEMQTNEFRNLYILTIPVLQISDDHIKKDSRLCEFFKNFLLLLRFFLRINPKIIFSQTKLFTILRDINEYTEEGYIIIKCMYKQFESMLPSQNLELFDFIREKLTKELHNIIKVAYGRDDNDIIQICFEIIYNLLKSGMDGLYNYRKYIFYGILHQSVKVNEITSKIIQEIYIQQASEKILFINVMQSMDLIYNTIFGLSDKIPFSSFNLSQKQKTDANILSELTRKKGNVFLSKDKRQIKMKTSFVKKIGDMIDADMNLLKARPTLFMLMMKLLKSQKVLDFCELWEIIFCLNKIVTNDQMHIQNVILKLRKDEQILKLRGDEQKVTKPTDFAIDTNTILAYRQLVSCLAYFTKYKKITQQLQDYNASFEKNLIPYTQFEEIIPLLDIKSQMSVGDKIDQIQKDINAFLDILLGEGENISLKFGKQKSNLSQRLSKGSKKVSNNQVENKKDHINSVSMDKLNLNSASLKSLTDQLKSYKNRPRGLGRKNYASLWHS